MYPFYVMYLNDVIFFVCLKMMGPKNHIGLFAMFATIFATENPAD